MFGAAHPPWRRVRLSGSAKFGTTGRGASRGCERCRCAGERVPGESTVRKALMGRFAAILLVSGTMALQVGVQAVLLGSIRLIFLPDYPATSASLSRR